MRGIAMVTGLVLTAGAAWAGPAQQACLAVERSPGPEACACAQVLADQTLTAGDQKLAAKIIRDPELFQKYSDNKGPRAQNFVARYRLWGERVELYCAGS